MVESPDAKAKGKDGGTLGLSSAKGAQALEEFLQSHEKAGDPQGFVPRRNYSLDALITEENGEEGGKEPLRRHAFRHALIQTDERTGEEFVHVHPECVDYLEEDGKPLPWKESMRIIEALLSPGATPPNVIAYPWQPGDMVLWDNRSTMHSTTPTHRNQEGSDQLYVALGERRLMYRTEMQATWTPHLVGEAPQVAVS